MARWLQRLTDYSRPVSDHHKDAVGWDTCAVGEVHADFPDVVLMNIAAGQTRRRQPPVDQRLDRLGKQFPVALMKNDRKLALAIYDKIQARVRTLVRKAGRRAQ